MSVTKKTIEPGNGRDKLKKGDTAYISYTVFLYDENKGNNGFRGDLVDNQEQMITIGEGEPMRKGLEGILEMTLGEWAILTIPPELGYGEEGCPDRVPSNAKLIMDIELTGINDKKAQVRRFGVLKWMTTLKEGNDDVRPVLGNLVTVDYSMWMASDQPGDDYKGDLLHCLTDAYFILTNSTAPMMECLRVMSLGQKVRAGLETGHIIEMELKAVGETEKQ